MLFQEAAHCTRPPARTRAPTSSRPHQRLSSAVFVLMITVIPVRIQGARSLGFSLQLPTDNDGKHLPSRHLLDTTPPQKEVHSFTAFI